MPPKIHSHQSLARLAPTSRNTRAIHVSFSRQNALSASGHASAGSTINPDEIAHFSRLSSQWWDERGEFGMLHKMNPVRMQFVRDKLVEIAYEDNPTATIEEYRILQGLSVLDVGCGGGLLSESLVRLGANTLGIDASASNIAIASLHGSSDPTLSLSSVSPSGSVPDTALSSAHKGKGKLRYENTSVESLLEEHGPSKFDVVCSMEVLEHVDHPRAFLNSCAQLVKPGGHLFLSTIARTPLAHFLTIFAAEQLLRFVEPGTHTYSKYVNPAELVSFFREYQTPSSPVVSAPESSTPESRPWITRLTGSGRPNRLEAEVRGMIYLPWRGEWVLAPRNGEGLGQWSEACNYLFWVRKPVA